MNIGILFDASTITKQGVLTEHSLLSSVSKIANQLEQMGHLCFYFEAVNGFRELAERGQDIDVVINYVPWTRTDKKILFPSLLNFIGLPFIGNSDEALMLCADKLLTKFIARENKIPVPQYTNIKDNSTFEKVKDSLGLPFVLKANKTSGSLGVRLIHTGEEYQDALECFSKLWETDIFAEEYISGIDITVPIMTEKGVPRALGTTTYVDEKHEKIPFFTHDYKYHEKLVCSNYCDFALASQALAYAERLHSLCRCTALSRVDFRLDAEGKLYLLEINGTPELNPSGAFTVAGTGRKFSDVLQLCLDEALRS